MFDLVAVPRLWISVKWPGLSPGVDEALAVSVEHEIEVEVEIIDRDELLVMFPVDVDPNDRRTSEQRQQAEFDTFKRLVSGWRKIKIGGKPADFTDDNIRALLRQPMFATGFELAYMRAWQGKGEAREKN